MLAIARCWTVCEPTTIVRKSIEWFSECKVTTRKWVAPLILTKKDSKGLEKVIFGEYGIIPIISKMLEDQLNVSGTAIIAIA